MVLTAIAFFLSIAGIAAFPCWHYSARWGFATSTVAGVLLFFVSLLIVGGKVATSEALAHRLVAPPQQQQAIVDSSMIEKISQDKAPAQPAIFIASPPIPLHRSIATVDSATAQ